MAQPFVGEIRMFGGNFAPNGWALCNGQLIAIDQNTVLFQLIGTTYGGDGVQTFSLPDLRGRVPIHQGTGPTGTPYIIGERFGTESVTLTVSQIPAHNHLIATSVGGTLGTDPNNNAANAVALLYSQTLSSSPPTMAAATIKQAGGSQPHDNIMPILAINFIIALFGIFPSQN